MSKQSTKLVYYAAWDTKVHFFIGGSRPQAWKKWLKFYKLPFKKGELPFDDECVEGSFIATETGKACAIWIRSRDLTSEKVSLIAHEATHAAGHILDRSGFKIVPADDSLLNDEPLAYLVQAIVRDLVAFIETGK